MLVSPQVRCRYLKSTVFPLQSHVWNHKLFRIIIPRVGSGKTSRMPRPLSGPGEPPCREVLVRTCHRPYSLSLKPLTTLMTLLLLATWQAEEPSCVVLAPIALPFQLPRRPRLLAPIPPANANPHLCLLTCPLFQRQPSCCT
jgi:hypothetical protein